MAKHSTIDSYLDSLTAPVKGIGTELRSILDAALPAAEGVVWHGHPVWMAGSAPLAGFKAYSNHVTFMIWQSRAIADPTGRLEFGPHMASVKVHSTSDIDRTAFSAWLTAAH